MIFLIASRCKELVAQALSAREHSVNREEIIVIELMRNKILMSILLVMLGAGVSTVNAAEMLTLISIPNDMSNSNAIGALKYAAIKRKWSIDDVENDSLRISLDHRGNQALLVFSIFEGNIVYIDSTMSRVRHPRRGRPSVYEWENTPAPTNWIKKLKSDTQALFYIRKKKEIVDSQLATNKKLSFEETEKRLMGL